MFFIRLLPVPSFTGLSSAAAHAALFPLYYVFGQQTHLRAQYVQADIYRTEELIVARPMTTIRSFMGDVR